MRLNRIDICSSIDFGLISTGFTAPFAFFLSVYRLKRYSVASYTGYITRYLLQNLTLDVRLPQSLSTSTSTTTIPVSLPLSTLPVSLLDQTEYKNNFEIEKIQLNKSENCGKRMVNLQKNIQFKEKWSRASQSYWPTQSSTDFDQSSTNWIKSNGFW